MKKSFEYIDSQVRLRLNQGFRLFCLLMQNSARSLVDPRWFDEEARFIFNGRNYVRLFGALHEFDPDNLATEIMIAKGYTRSNELMTGVEAAFTRNGSGQQQVTIWAARSPTGTPQAIADWQEAVTLSAAFSEFRGDYAKILRYLADYVESGKVPPAPQ